MIYKNISRPTCFSLRVCRLVGFLFLSFGIASDPLSLVELSVSGSFKKKTDSLKMSGPYALVMAHWTPVGS